MVWSYFVLTVKLLRTLSFPPFFSFFFFSSMSLFKLKSHLITKVLSGLMGAFSRVQTHPEYSHQTQVCITLFAIFLKSFCFFFVIDRIPQMMIQFCYFNYIQALKWFSVVCCNVRMARVDMDLNQKKLGQLFQVLMLCKKQYGWCSLMKFV